jgi:hypothetical protein
MVEVQPATARAAAAVAQAAIDEFAFVVTGIAIVDAMPAVLRVAMLSPQLKLSADHVSG